MEIRDVKTFEEFVNAVNRLGLNFSEEKAIQAQNDGLLPIFPKFFEIGGDVLNLAIDFVDNLTEEDGGLAYSDIELQGSRGAYRVVIGPQIVDLAKRYDSIVPISFALKHELKHLLDHQVPFGNKELWNLAADVVINEQLMKRTQLPGELVQKIATVENIQKMERKLCMKCGVNDCEKYLVSEEDLNSYMPIFRIYYKLYGLMQKCPRVIKIVEYYNNQFHKKKSKCNSSQCNTQSGNKNNNTNNNSESENTNKNEDQKKNNIKDQEKKQEGDSNNDNEKDKEKEFYEKHRYHPVRTAGTDKFIEDLRKIDAGEMYLPWHELLKNILIGAVTNSEVIYPDWSKTNRRFVQYYQYIGAFIPSFKQTKPPNGFAIVDTSGSIWDDLYKKFIEAIKGLMHTVKPERVEVVFFSDTIVDKKVLEPDNVPEMPRPGEGGTLICDAMKYVYKNMTDEDFVVVLSDFEIFDDNSCKDIIENIGMRASAAIQVVPPSGNIANKWKHWKQIIVNEW